MQEALRYAEGHFDEFIESLKAMVRIPSISFTGFPPEEVEKSASFIAQHLKESGLQNVEILRVGKAHPYVYGEWLHAPGKPTLLLYAHHDVQPVGRLEKWKTPPFEPTLVDGRLYGRGTADDKAGVVVHTSAILSFLKTEKKLPVNVKMIVEGEEEIGSGHLEEFLEKYQSRLKCDAIVLTDTGNYDTGIPTITTSLRGLVAIEVELKSMKSSLHSGSWGGPLPDPVIALSKMISELATDDLKIAIPGIYDQVRPMSEVERRSVDSLNFTEADVRAQAGLLKNTQIVGGDESPLVKMTRLPSIAVNAIQASSRANPANIINDSAWCKIGIRIVPDMDPQRTETLLRNFLMERVPWGLECHIKCESTASWWMTEPSGPMFEAACTSLTEAFGKDCVYMGTGGTIPFMQPFNRIFGNVPSLLIGVEDPYTNPHSENESVHLGDLKKAILGAIRFYKKVSELPR